MIQIRNLRFFYDERQILNIKKLNLNTSQITILMGENGSGKSTLLHILAFLKGDFSQSVSYWGKRKLTLNEKRQICLLFAEPALLNRSVRQNFIFALKTHGVKANFSERIKEAFALLELDEGLLDKHSVELSSGQSQKIAFGILLSLRARYYLLDEPTAFLDKNASLLFKKAILHLQKRYNCGFFIASHDKIFLDALAQKRLYLHSAEILEFDNTNVFDLANFRAKFKMNTLQTKLNKIAINPYKIKVNEHLAYVIKNAKIIALRQKDEFIFVRVLANDEILELAILQSEFKPQKIQIGKIISISFDEKALKFLA